MNPGLPRLDKSDEWLGLQSSVENARYREVDHPSICGLRERCEKLILYE
jgi:hypothetical protein